MSIQQSSEKKHEKPMGKIIDEIIALIEKGTLPWRKPWGEETAYVIIGGMQYRTDMWPSNVRAPAVFFGIQHGLQLLLKARKEEYKTNLWVTQKALIEIGAKIDSHQKGHALYTWDSSSPSSVYYNIEQINNYESALGVSYKDCEDKDSNKTKIVRYKESKKRVEYLKKRKNLIVIENQAEACYLLDSDVIHMPKISKEEDFQATLWHEIVHWTGHKSRLNRLKPAIFGDDKYAFEELVAELGAAFICSQFGIEDECQFASYVDGWVKNFQENGYQVLHHAGEFAQAAAQHALSKKLSKKIPEPASPEDAPLFFR